MRSSGIVKWFNRLRGYGFIEDQEDNEEVFVHYSAIDGEGYQNLYEGDRVSFDRTNGEKGLQATNVRIKRLW